MNILKGRAVCGGFAAGKVSVYRKKTAAEKKHIEDFRAESEKFAAVRSLAIDELDRLFLRAHAEIGEDAAQIFSIHKMMLADCSYSESVLGIIERERVSAEAAVLMTAESFGRIFSGLDSAYMRERADDIRDVSDRVIALLGGKSRPYPDAAEENTVIFADNIAPSEAMQMDKSKVCAFVTEAGSANSHTAVLARSLGIPAVAGVKISGGIEGRSVAVDGYTGTVYLEPDAEVLARLKEDAARRAELNKRLEAEKNAPAVTKSGRRVTLSADISAPEEVKGAMPDFCDGVGVLRTEELFAASAGFPSESYQFDAYRKVLEGMGKRPVSVRAFDMDEDKKGNFFGIFREKNPLMGMRAIRLCLMRPELFKIQLRAVIRAAVCGRIRLLLPMLVSAEEIGAVKRLLKEARLELEKCCAERDGNIPIGAVIETPAAVLNADELAREADFFMIDADSLAQYILAADRRNTVLAERMDMRGGAVLRAIEKVTAAAHKRDIEVGLCGALASDAAVIPALLEMGIDELSVTPEKLLCVRRAVRESE